MAILNPPLYHWLENPRILSSVGIRSTISSCRKYLPANFAVGSLLKPISSYSRKTFTKRHRCASCAAPPVWIVINWRKDSSCCSASHPINTIATWAWKKVNGYCVKLKWPSVKLLTCWVMNSLPISVRPLRRSLGFHRWQSGANSKISRSVLQYARPTDLDQKYHIYHYRHIFGYLYSGCTVAVAERTTWKNGKKCPAAKSKIH